MKHESEGGLVAEWDLPHEVPVSRNGPGDFAQDRTKLSVEPLLDGGLDAYRAKSRAACASVLRAGASRAVVTFRRPINSQELAAFALSGVQLVSIEAIGHKASRVITAGGPAETGAVARLVDMAKEDGAAFDGIVAAEVVVPTQQTFAAADADPRVYLVDLSVEIVRRWAGPSHEVGMNDLYWTLAGLK
jgi:hypothetical protein